MSRSARPELLALLDDVQSNPDDLTPWLVLGDWLEENGDEADRARSEYCRLCFDKLGKTTYASDWEKGERRRDLFRRYKQDWFGPILSFQVQMKKGLAIVSSNPGMKPHSLIEALQVEEPWAWVEGLYWHAGGFAKVQDFVALANAPGMSCLHRLTLRCETPGVHAARALADSPHMGRLTSFSLDTSQPRKVSAEVRRILQDRFGEAVRIW